jgi:hypothetical protein
MHAVPPNKDNIQYDIAEIEITPSVNIFLDRVNILSYIH